MRPGQVHDDIVAAYSRGPYGGGSGADLLGYVNNAFIECAAEEPEAFAFAPIADLSPVWGYHLNNHPDTPDQKYEVGRVSACLPKTGCYGREGQSHRDAAELRPDAGA